MKDWQRAFLPISILTTVVFIPALQFSSVQMDDPKHIFENPLFLDSSFSSFLYFWKSAYFGMYIPVTYSLWKIVGALSWAFTGRLDPGYFHALNLVVHLLNGFLFCRLVQSYGPFTKPHSQMSLALLVGIFLLHPVQVESVAWISGAKDLLAVTFALVSWLFYQEWKQSRSRACAVATIVFFVLGNLSKPSIISLVAVIVCVDYFVVKHPFPTPIKNPLTVCLLAAIPLALLAKSLQPHAEILSAPQWWQRPLVASYALGFYVSKLFFPFPLLFDYGKTPQAILEDSTIAMACFVGLIGLCYFFQKNKLPQQISLLFFLSLLPVLGFIPFRFQLFSTVADHYLYFPLLVILVGLGVSGMRFVNHFPWVGIGVLILLSVLSSWQLRHWKNTESLLAHNLRYNPQSFIAHNNLGVELYHTKRFAQAAWHFSQVAKLRPEEASIYGNWGASLVSSGQTARGIDVLERQYAKEPTSSLAYNLILALIKASQFERARDVAKRHLGREPHNETLQKLLAHTDTAQAGRKAPKLP